MMISCALNEGIEDVAVVISLKVAYYKINCNLVRKLNVHQKYAFSFSYICMEVDKKNF